MTVIGAGSWGTALAIQLAHKGLSVSLWGHRPEAMLEMAEQRENRKYLPDIQFPDTLYPESNLKTALEESTLVVLVVPSHAFRETLQKIQPFLAGLSNQIGIVWATKGLEHSTQTLLHQVFQEELPELAATQRYAVLSGPTFAREVALHLPTAVTIASPNQPFAQQLSETFRSETFRCYTSNDVVGVEIGGAAKNVLAIAAGIADGLGFGANARAALITRGLHELIRLGTHLDGQLETFMGLSGMGDLVLTCTDDQSRNRRFGLAVGQGQSTEEAIHAIGQVVEGFGTTQEVHLLAKKHQIELPIIEQIYQILYQDKDPKQAVSDLLHREPKHEFDPVSS